MPLPSAKGIRSCSVHTARATSARRHPCNGCHSGSLRLVAACAMAMTVRPSARVRPLCAVGVEIDRRASRPRSSHHHVRVVDARLNIMDKSSKHHERVFRVVTQSQMKTWRGLHVSYVWFDLDVRRVANADRKLETSTRWGSDRCAVGPSAPCRRESTMSRGGMVSSPRRRTGRGDV